MNRHDRRKADAEERKSRRLLRLRCSGCDRVGLPMTKEHFFPRWLIESAQVHHEGITWLDGQTVDPDKATIPLCRACNEAFGTTLEGPVAEIFRQLEQGASISEEEAEVLVRWLWKFEGLQWTAGPCFALIALFWDGRGRRARRAATAPSHVAVRQGGRQAGPVLCMCSSSWSRTHDDPRQVGDDNGYSYGVA